MYVDMCGLVGQCLFVYVCGFLGGRVDAFVHQQADFEFQSALARYIPCLPYLVLPVIELGSRRCGVFPRCREAQIVGQRGVLHVDDRIKPGLQSVCSGEDWKVKSHTHNSKIHASKHLGQQQTWISSCTLPHGQIEPVLDVAHKGIVELPRSRIPDQLAQHREVLVQVVEADVAQARGVKRVVLGQEVGRVDWDLRVAGAHVLQRVGRKEWNKIHSQFLGTVMYIHSIIHNSNLKMHTPYLLDVVPCATARRRARTGEAEGRPQIQVAVVGSVVECQHDGDKPRCAAEGEHGKALVQLLGGEGHGGANRRRHER